MYMRRTRRVFRGGSRRKPSTFGTLHDVDGFHPPCTSWRRPWPRWSSAFADHVPSLHIHAPEGGPCRRAHVGTIIRRGWRGGGVVVEWWPSGCGEKNVTCTVQKIQHDVDSSLLHCVSTRGERKLHRLSWSRHRDVCHRVRCDMVVPMRAGSHIRRRPRSRMVVATVGVGWRRSALALVGLRTPTATIAETTTLITAAAVTATLATSAVATTIATPTITSAVAVWPSGCARRLVQRPEFAGRGRVGCLVRHGLFEPILC